MVPPGESISRGHGAPRHLVISRSDRDSCLEGAVRRRSRWFRSGRGSWCRARARGRWLRRRLQPAQLRAQRRPGWPPTPWSSSTRFSGSGSCGRLQRRRAGRAALRPAPPRPVDRLVLICGGFDYASMLVRPPQGTPCRRPRPPGTPRSGCQAGARRRSVPVPMLTWKEELELRPCSSGMEDQRDRAARINRRRWSARSSVGHTADTRHPFLGPNPWGRESTSPASTKEEPSSDDR